MKIGFPAAGISGDQKYCFSNSFIENGLMGVCDTETGHVKVISKQNLGKSLMAWVKEQEIGAIITPELKVMALKVFREQGIDVYKAEGTFLKLNLELLMNSSLPAFSVLDMFDEGASSCSSSDCSSCSSISECN